LTLRTTNPIESTFATVRHRTKFTKGPGSRAAGLAMAFKLIQSAQDHWRSVNAPHLVALVRAGAVFSNGVLIERTPYAEGMLGHPGLAADNGNIVTVWTGSSPAAIKVVQGGTGF
jgi:hypothetical protein